jgi:hypothetical protein
MAFIALMAAISMGDLKMETKKETTQSAEKRSEDGAEVGTEENATEGGDLEQLGNDS